MELERNGEQLIYYYQVGLFDKNGDWVNQVISKKDVIESIRKRHSFSFLIFYKRR